MTEQTRGTKHDDLPHWGGGVGPGVPGAGWFIAIFFVFAVGVLTSWAAGWGENSRNVAASSAQAPAHHTTGMGNRKQQ